MSVHESLEGCASLLLAPGKTLAFTAINVIYSMRGIQEIYSYNRISFSFLCFSLSALFRAAGFAFTVSSLPADLCSAVVEL